MLTPGWKLELINVGTVPAPKSGFTEKKDISDLGNDKIHPFVASHKNDITKKSVSAYLQSYESTDENTNKVDGLPVYAIIGCGFAATLNRATLTEEKIEGLTVVHIGFPDPWKGYVRHNMNQAVELNTLPGYLNQPDLPSDKHSGTPQKRWLPSDEFATCNAAERKRFIGKGKDQEIQATVKSITIDKETGYFKIQLNNGKENIMAKHVDICTGIGPQRLASPGRPDMTKELWEDYFQAIRLDDDPSSKRVSAVEMYVRGTSKASADGYICVTGASPGSIQAIEHALCEDEADVVDIKEQRQRRYRYPGSVKGGLLVSSGLINEGFLPIGRLDDHGMDAEGNPFVPRDTVPDGNIFPTREGIWFAESYAIESVEPLTSDHLDLFKKNESTEGVTEADVAANMLLVKFKVDTRKKISKRLVSNDITSDGGDLVYGKFHQVVLGTGRYRNDEQGSAIRLISELKNDLGLIAKPNLPPAGLQLSKKHKTTNQEMRLRIIGAAGINNPIFIDKNGVETITKTPLWTYQSTLPMQSHVAGEGVTLAGHTIAWANEHITSVGVNSNINTANEEELRTFVGPEVAKQIIQIRMYRIGPLISERQLLRILETQHYWEENKENLVSEEELRNARVETGQLKKALKEATEPHLLRLKKHLSISEQFTFGIRGLAENLKPEDSPKISDINNITKLYTTIIDAFIGKEGDIYTLHVADIKDNGIPKAAELVEHLEKYQVSKAKLVDIEKVNQLGGKNLIQLLNNDAIYFNEDEWKKLKRTFQGTQWNSPDLVSLKDLQFRPNKYLGEQEVAVIEKFEDRPFDK